MSFNYYRQNIFACIESDGRKLTPQQKAFLTLKFLNYEGSIKAESYGTITKLKREIQQLREMIRKAKKCLIHETS